MGLKLVQVTWLDAVSHDDTVDRKTTIGMKRRTVGYLVADRKSGVVLAMDHSEGEFKRGFAIPRPYIKKIRYL